MSPRIVILGKGEGRRRFALALARHVAERFGPVRLLDDGALALFPSDGEGACVLIDLVAPRWETAPVPGTRTAWLARGPAVLTLLTDRVSILQAPAVVAAGPFRFAAGRPELAAPAVADALRLSGTNWPERARHAEEECARLHGQLDRAHREAEACEQYRQQLLEIGKLIGCDHIDDGLVHCVASAIRGGEA